MIVAKSAAYKQALWRAFSGGTAETGLWMKHSSQLKVMHTNQWPIPYYRRTMSPRNWFPDTDYNVKLQGTEVEHTDSLNVAMAERYLRTRFWGFEVLETINNEGVPGNDKLTRITSPSQAANIYMSDLLKHIHYTNGENQRILKKHKFASILD